MLCGCRYCSLSRTLARSRRPTACTRTLSCLLDDYLSVSLALHHSSYVAFCSSAKRIGRYEMRSAITCRVMRRSFIDWTVMRACTVAVSVDPPDPFRGQTTRLAQMRCEGKPFPARSRGVRGLCLMQESNATRKRTTDGPPREWLDWRACTVHARRIARPTDRPHARPSRRWRTERGSMRRLSFVELSWHTDC